jgi:hypothetical protein
MIVNPRALRFESPSHGGDPIVAPTSYLVELLPEGQSEPTVTVDVAASSALPVNGSQPAQYEIPFSAIAYPWGISFAARLRAKNAAGQSAPSAPTDPFLAEPAELEGTARLTFGAQTYVMQFTYRVEP